MKPLKEQLIRREGYSHYLIPNLEPRLIAKMPDISVQCLLSFLLHSTLDQLGQV